MPEGDTLWRTARALDQALAGRVLTGFASSLAAVEAAARRLTIVGREVARVEAQGKHLLVRFAGGPALHTHLGMRGSWALRAPGPWPRAGQRLRALLATDAALALCWNAPVVELLGRAAAAEHPALVRLGPDLLAPGFRPEEACARLRQRGGEELGVAVMDQTALAGIGNVYKSETLFLCGLHPRRRVSDLSDAELLRVVTTARDLLRRNLGSGPRRTSSPLAPFHLWVYKRSKHPCRRCGAEIVRIVQGEQARSTYFCPACQP